MARGTILSLAPNSSFMMLGKGDSQEEAYVITVSDPTKNIFKGTRVATKASVDFNSVAPKGPATEVTIIETPQFSTTVIGIKLLSEL
jgi:hypothetical protein